MNTRRRRLPGTRKDYIALASKEKKDDEGTDSLSLDDGPPCWICFECGDTDDFFSPCECKGSGRRIHRACLRTWLRTAVANSPGSDPSCPRCFTTLRLDLLYGSSNDPWPRWYIFPRWSTLGEEYKREVKARMFASFAFGTASLLVLSLAALRFCLYHWNRAKDGPGELVPLLGTGSVTHVVGLFFFGAAKFSASEELVEWWGDSWWGVRRAWSECWLALARLMYCWTMIYLLKRHDEAPIRFSSAYWSGLCFRVSMFSLVRAAILLIFMPCIRPWPIVHDLIYRALMTAGSTMTVVALFFAFLCMDMAHFLHAARYEYAAIKRHVRAMAAEVPETKANMHT